MIDEDEAGKPEGEALPETPPPQGGFFSPEVFKRAEAAVDGWYAQHFHRAALQARQPISADDKAALVRAVAQAFTPEE